MKFLVDAQLPSSLATLLRAAGHDAVHVSTLPSGNRTPDSEIARRADSDQRVVVTQGSRLPRQPPTQRHSAFAAHRHDRQHPEPRPARPVRTSHRCHRGVPDRFPTRRTFARSPCRSLLERHQVVTNAPRTQRDPVPLSTCESCFRRGDLKDLLATYYSFVDTITASSTTTGGTSTSATTATPGSSHPNGWTRSENPDQHNTANTTPPHNHRSAMRRVMRRWRLPECRPSPQQALRGSAGDRSGTADGEASPSKTATRQNSFRGR